MQCAVDAGGVVGMRLRIDIVIIVGIAVARKRNILVCFANMHAGLISIWGGAFGVVCDISRQWCCLGSRGAIP